MAIKELCGDKILLLGYGREGKSTHKYLLSKYTSLEIDIADEKTADLIEESKPSTKTFVGTNYLDPICNYSTVIRSPGISPAKLAAQSHTSKTHITSATNIFFANCPGKIIGITGTKGKSTTSALTAHILKSEFNDIRLVGNIGYPMLDSLQDASSESIFVVELSSFQLEDIRYSPNFSVILNIVPEHTDHHNSFDAYIAAKSKITKFQSKKDYLFINTAFPTIKAISIHTHAIVCNFSDQKDINSKSYFDVCDLYYLSNEKHIKLLNASDISLLGAGNRQNVLAATSIASVLKLLPDNVRESIKTFKPLPHRLEPVGEFLGIRFINDSLATVPEAMANALDALSPGVETLIAGGHDRGLDYSVVRDAIYRSSIKNLILFPTTGEKILEAIADFAADRKINVTFVSDMKEAVTASYSQTSKGKVVLMSPASSSFNLFKDYQDRGDQFKYFVKTIGESS